MGLFREKGGCLRDFGGVSKLMDAYFCVSVFVYAYGSGCIGVSVWWSVCLKRGSVVIVCVCMCVCMYVCVCVCECVKEG